jgi:hypothetical protein
MGIETAVMGGTAIANAVMGNKVAKGQERVLTRAADQSTALQREMFERGLELTAPFREAGASALPGLQRAANAELTPFAFDYNAYFASPEYAAMSQQAQNNVLANASMTGGMRSGGNQVALSAIAPQLAQQGRQNAMSEYQLNQAAEMDRYNRLSGLAGLGMGLSGQAASQAGQFGAAAGNNALFAGQARGNRYVNQANLFKGLTTDILGAYNPSGGVI